MYNTVFGKAMANVRKHRDIKIVAIEARKYFLVSEPKYHITKSFSEDLLVTEMKTIWMLMNKSVYLGLSLLSETKMVRKS